MGKENVDWQCQRNFGFQQNPSRRHGTPDHSLRLHYAVPSRVPTTPRPNTSTYLSHTCSPSRHTSTPSSALTPQHVAPAPGWHVATPERVAIKSTNPPRISPASTPRARPTTARAVTSDPLSCTQAVLASACRRKRLSSHGVKSALAARLRNAGVVPDFFSHAFNHFQ